MLKGAGVAYLWLDVAGSVSGWGPLIVAGVVGVGALFAMHETQGLLR